MYLDILTAISQEKKSITELSTVIGKTSSNAGRMVTILQERGFVRRVFGGNFRYVRITEEGEKILKGVGE